MEAKVVREVRQGSVQEAPKKGSEEPFFQARGRWGKEEQSMDSGAVVGVHVEDQVARPVVDWIWGPWGKGGTENESQCPNLIEEYWAISWDYINIVS